MPDIEFRDPPTTPRAVSSPEDLDPTKNRDRPWIIEQLRTHPGRWAVVSRHSSRPAASKVARVLRVRHADFEFQACRHEAGGVVYAQFVHVPRG